MVGIGARGRSRCIVNRSCSVEQRGEGEEHGIAGDSGKVRREMTAVSIAEAEIHVQLTGAICSCLLHRLVEKVQNIWIK